MRNLSPGHPDHPDKILFLEKPLGISIYMNGDINEADCGAVAVVGTRKPDIYGINMAREITSVIVKSGRTVISGLARGIDTESHRAAIDCGGRTVAVLGSGINDIYPEENIALAGKISKKGAVISQFPPDAPPAKKNFPIRNETVAKLCNSLVVIQAPERSGSLITARLAVENNKQVYVLVGNIDNEKMLGNFRFLESYKKNPLVRPLFFPGAVFSKSCSQMEIPQTASENEELSLSSEEREVIKALRKSENKELFFDKISNFTGIGPDKLPAVLLSLSMKGLINEIGGNRYSI